ncbi:type II toxin-antitoxin system mRNA interferase toxin, RelE/StbE family [Candidatus Micrarchaeota archaeon]|nr:type II toxin-antitoxin system mRNA interferase toxin, RelE/StbE family [Candidatus Micrarchaeota archaeon]
MYSLELKQGVYVTFKKLEKKGKKKLEIINNKIQEILENPKRFKPLRAPMQNLRRVHIDKSFVLVYEINEQAKTVVVLDYDHHDNVYKH